MKRRSGGDLYSKKEPAIVGKEKKKNAHKPTL